MTERPILFQGSMVRAVLPGIKTQTRRALKQAVGPSLSVGIEDETGVAELSWLYGDGPGHEVYERTLRVPCPYGRPGDRLWGRETFYAFGRWETRYSEKKGRDEWHFLDMTLELGLAYRYAADSDELPHMLGRKEAGSSPMWWKRPAIFMPRAACRLECGVADVRVERLRDISEADALAEGIVPLADGYGLPDGSHFHATDPRQSYLSLWEAINGPGSVEANPWVWAVSFKRQVQTQEKGGEER